MMLQKPILMLIFDLILADNGTDSKTVERRCEAAGGGR